MDITWIIRIVFLILAGIYTYVLVPYVKAKTTADEREQLLVYIRAGVHAAEMLYKETGMGTLKKAYVLKYLEHLGYIVDTDEVDALIEATVFDMKKALE